MALSNGGGGARVEFQPMSPEEIERTMQFLLNQQAQFAVDLSRLSGKTDQIADGLIGLTALVGRVVDAVSARQDRTDEQLRATDEKLRETGDYIKTVESHLNVLIEMFERSLREDRGRDPF
jgi:predicted  nucleic acid-binding Zn-ribbon protein